MFPCIVVPDPPSRERHARAAVTDSKYGLTKSAKLSTNPADYLLPTIILIRPNPAKHAEL